MPQSKQYFSFSTSSILSKSCLEVVSDFGKRLTLFSLGFCLRYKVYKCKGLVPTFVPSAGCWLSSLRQKLTRSPPTLARLFILLAIRLSNFAFVSLSEFFLGQGQRNDESAIGRVRCARILGSI